jgi:hypothetical protein
MNASADIPAARAEPAERQGITLADIASAAPDLVMAAAFLAAWTSPSLLPEVPHAGCSR